MKFGHFDDAAKEYVITSPKTPLPWINYLGCEDFFHWFLTPAEDTVSIKMPSSFVLQDIVTTIFLMTAMDIITISKMVTPSGIRDGCQPRLNQIPISAGMDQATLFLREAKISYPQS